MGYHEERCNNPVDEDAKGDLFPDTAIGEDMVQSLEADFAENRIHHD